MFEGVVSQVLLGYLGRYVKGIQKDQLKIGIWSEEVLLEKVELILEAFDYLQLPFALKNGSVGKLSIKIPWKKLGWEPIIVVLEDVFVCACQRGDDEWSSTSVARRELAGKMAKLNAIELAKFSRRVSDNQAGQSFISYISAKILDSIQVSIRNVHIVYIDTHNGQGNYMFGLEFSALSIMTDTRKQNSTMSTIGKARSGQVNKIVEISNAGFYCNLFEGNQDLTSIDGIAGAELFSNKNVVHERYDYMVNPFDVTVSLMANKSVKLVSAPQYAIIAEITALVITMNELQMEQILSLCDYFSICALREKYGRYRPSQMSLTLKPDGWQRMWWQYAQESVLSDVRQKLRKTSWSNLGRRISYRRKYVELYQRKLELLQQEQVVSQDILHELEVMDKECDIDDILSCRDIAEHKLQEFSNSKASTGITHIMPVQEKLQSDERSSSRARGWLNWLSLGMLGAGGTADSSFAGIVSDEIIKDIYEATEFHPVPSLNVDSSIKDKFCSSSIKLSIHEIVFTISIKGDERKIAEGIFCGSNIGCEVWEDSIAILALIDSVKIINPHNENIMLMVEKAIHDEGLSVHTIPFINVEVDFPRSNQNSEHSVKVVFQPFEATLELEFVLDVFEFCYVLASFQFQKNRVLNSLNGLKDLKVRLPSKAEYVSHSRTKMNWDVNLHNSIIKLPLEKKEVEVPILALQLEGLFFKSRIKIDDAPQMLSNGHCSATCTTDRMDGTPADFQFEDLYDHFEISLAGFEMNLLKSNLSGAISIVEKFNASVGLGLCNFLDEPMLKALEINCVLPSLGIHFSPTILDAFIGTYHKLVAWMSGEVMGSDLHGTDWNKPDSESYIRFSVSVDLDHFSFYVSLEDDAENSTVVSFNFESTGISCAFDECVEVSLYIKMLKVDTSNLKGESTSNILCSSRNGSLYPHNHIEHVDRSMLGITFSEGSSTDNCLELLYHTQIDSCVVHHEYQICLNDVDLHIYPRILGLLLRFFDRLNMQSFSSDGCKEKTVILNQNGKDINIVDCELLKRNYADIPETVPELSVGTPLEHFPFVTIFNSGFLSNLEGSLMYGATESDKSYMTNQQYPGRQKLIFRKRFKIIDLAAMKSPSSSNAVNLPMDLDYLNSFLLDLNDLRVHFHDSSCILGTVTLPKSRSSLSFNGTDCWDALISTDGLLLSSSWSPPNIHKPLWGPISPGVSPILNVRVRKKQHKALQPLTEICFGIEHVCCVLPSDFLAMLIGYFLLPDWTLKGYEQGDEQSTSENIEVENFDSINSVILYKFEILHSSLILPIESHTEICLQLVLPQLYCSFIPTSMTEDADRDIPSHCLISPNSIAYTRNIINLFGRSTSLSLLTLSDADRPSETSPLIEHLDADLWIRIPCKANTPADNNAIPTLVMTRVNICNVIVEDVHFIRGFEATVNVVEELSLVGKESELFRSDVLLFLQLKRNLKDANTGILEIANDSLLSMKFCAMALSMKFARFRLEHSPSDIVAKADMQVNFSGLIRSGISLNIDVEIPRLVLCAASHSNIPLLSFISDSFISSVLFINFSRSDQGDAALLLAIPSLDIWLHLSEWKDFFGLIDTITKQSDGTSSSGSPPSVYHAVPESHLSSCAAEYVKPDAIFLTMMSENILISFHLPISDIEENVVKSEVDEESKFYSQELPEQSLARLLSIDSNYRKYVKVTLQSKFCELTMGENYTKLKCNVEKMRVMLEMIQNSKVSSLAFLQISQVKMETELHRRQGEVLHILLEVQVESLDVGLSYQTFNFWSGSRLKFPEVASSEIPCYCLVFKGHLRKGSLILSDGRWSYHGPILEILMKNVLVQFNQIDEIMEGSTISDLLINYNNIDKVVWEPFAEPWGFQLNLLRKYTRKIHLNTSTRTEVYLESKEHLNLNITEPLIEAMFRIKQMIDDALDQNQADGLQESQDFEFESTDDLNTRRYAPYILQNDTSLPLKFHVSHGPISTDDIGSFSMKPGNIAQPGHTLPIYVEETLDEQFFRHRTAHSSERLLEKKMSAFAHHMISIQLDGTTGPSKPMSMDLVGRSYFEVNFSNNKQSTTLEVGRDEDASDYSRKTEKYLTEKEGLVVPVVFEVSMQHYSKMIRLYSTVILFNATVLPLELRFDIPFGVSPKILGPIFPGQELPLPLHLAEAGRIRWRPVGSTYLWSEAHSLSNILSQEYRLGFLRSCVCYPAHPTSDPFRCCISVRDYSLSPSGGTRNCSSLDSHRTGPSAVESVGQRMLKPKVTKEHLIRQVTLTTPLLVKNYLPTSLLFTIESSGMTNSISLSEVDTASIFMVDSTHDLGITIDLQGFRSVHAKFPRAESFSAMAKLNGPKYYLSEMMPFYPITSGGPTYVTLEKAMDVLCGAREICLSVSFLLYNCTGLPLAIVDDNHEMKESAQLIPSCYYLIGNGQLLPGNQGLAHLSSELESCPSDLHVSACENADEYLPRLSTRHFPTPISYRGSCEYPSCNYLHERQASVNNLVNRLDSFYLAGKVGNGVDHPEIGFSREVKAYMYAPHSHISSSELMVKLCASLPQRTEIAMNQTWSSPFPLLPASGSTNVVIPKPSGSGAFLISATSIPVTGELSERTRALMLQPRYIICNTCDKDLCYRQRGTNTLYHLGVGQHSHLHWSNTARELYVSIRFNEPGWQWSGSFLPDCLGDVQVKMRNYVSGASKMVRIEVQNADLAISDERIIRNSNQNSTQLILLSDDKTGFMPYRIDNFSMERLRIYQQKCESFETIVHAYTSCQYAWDEPSYPHRLIVEVPGERIVGTYSLDSTQEYVPVCLPSTSEKSERRLYISIHAEGAIKVLSIADSSYHILKDVPKTGFLGSRENTKADYAHFGEVITLHLSFIGISLMNSSPQELLYACVREATFSALQSSDQQKVSLHILSLQIDNQLTDTPYPIMLSVDNEHRGRSTNFLKNKEHKLRIQNENLIPSACDSVNESVFYLAAAKWRNADSSLVSFEYINLGLAPLCIELEDQIILSLFDFFRTVTSRLKSRSLQKNFELHALDHGMEVLKVVNVHGHKNRLSKFSRTSETTETNSKSQLLPNVIPIGAPWQKVYHSARRQKKVYVEAFELAPIKLSLSFSSTPWMMRNGVHSEVNNLTQISSTTFQRSLMALVDVEGVPVHLRQLVLTHIMASHESVQEIITRHYMRQLFHEIYKVFGSAGVIGNPMGFARNVGIGIKDFVSVSTKGIVQSPLGLLTGVAQGSKSLISNTIYAMSSATTQFSKAAHKGIVAFTFDEQAVAEMDVQLKGLESHGKGVLNEFLEGLTGLLQSPIRGAEKHGLPGILSGIAMGTAGLVARPVASILEATSKTAQSIRNRSSPHQSNRLRVRFPRPLARELPLLPYSWEEAIGVSMLLKADGSRLKDEVFVICKALKQAGKFVVISERLVLVFWCSCLVGLGSPEFVGVAADPEWVIEVEMTLESIVHLDRAQGTVNIVGSNTETVSKQKKGGVRSNRSWSPPAAAVPLFYMSTELQNQEEAEDVLQVLLSAIEQGKEHRWGVHVLHRSNPR